MKSCRNCGEVEPDVCIRTSGPHYADLFCPKCKRHLGFLAKPSNDNKTNRRLTPTPEDLNIGLCQLCRRPAYHLGDGWLEVHHLDVNPENNDPDNLIVVCKMCHTHIHHVQMYVNKHLSRYHGE